MTFINHAAALRGVQAFGTKYDPQGYYQYRFELEDDGRCMVGVYSDTGVFLTYV